MRQRYNQIVDSGGEVVAVSFEPKDRLLQLRRQMKLPFPVLSDPERDVYRAYGLERGSWHKIFAPKTVAAYAAHFLKGGGYTHRPSDWKQLGGDFVLDREGVIIFEHRGESPHDRPKVEDLVAAVEGSNTSGHDP